MRLIPVATRSPRLPEMRLPELNALLADRRVHRLGLCYGSIVHIVIDGGSIDLGGADWTLTVDGVLSETAENIAHSQNLQPLVGRCVRELRISDADTCELIFDDALLSFENCFREGYEIGAEMFTLYHLPSGQEVVDCCLISAPLSADEVFEWCDAKSTPATFNPKRHLLRGAANPE